MKQKKDWFDNQKNVDKLILGLCGICLVLLGIDLFYEKHSQVFLEDLFGFYCFYGFVICFVIVLGGNILRKIVLRKENFYDD